MIENHSFTPQQISEQFSILQLAALSAPSGKLSKEQALTIINDRRAKKGLKPLESIP